MDKGNLNWFLLIVKLSTGRADGENQKKEGKEKKGKEMQLEIFKNLMCSENDSHTGSLDRKV